MLYFLSISDKCGRSYDWLKLHCLSLLFYAQILGYTYYSETAVYVEYSLQEAYVTSREVIFNYVRFKLATGMAYLP